MILDFEPGDKVFNPKNKNWGVGQVQSIIKTKVTVNFENAGKKVINAENIETANLLNENLGKLNELTEDKNGKFSNFFEGNSNNNFNNQKKNKVIDNSQIENRKKSIDKKKTIISNHNIDVQA